MPAKVYNVLFLCTGNSARSILAEALIDHWENGQFKGYSAGSFPKGAVNPLSLKLLDRLDMPTAHLRSKSWDEFAAHGAPAMEFVFTFCDQAAGEVVNGADGVAAATWTGALATSVVFSGTNTGAAFTGALDSGAVATCCCDFSCLRLSILLRANRANTPFGN